MHSTHHAATSMVSVTGRLVMMPVVVSISRCGISVHIIMLVVPRMIAIHSISAAVIHRDSSSSLFVEGPSIVDLHIGTIHIPTIHIDMHLCTAVGIMVIHKIRPAGSVGHSREEKNSTKYQYRQCLCYGSFVVHRILLLKMKALAFDIHPDVDGVVIRYLSANMQILGQ